MRINAYLIGALMALLTSFLFTSCSNDNDKHELIIDPSEVLVVLEQGGFVKMADDLTCTITVYVNPDVAIEMSQLGVTTLNYEAFSTDPDFELRWKLAILSLEQIYAQEPLWAVTLGIVDGSGNRLVPDAKYKYKLEFNKTYLQIEDKYRTGEFSTGLYYGLDDDI